MTHTVELLKPTAEQNTRRYDEKSKQYVGESFDRGERIIMVDGIRWGRVNIHHHGCHGPSYTFQQQGAYTVEWKQGDSGGEVSKDYDSDGYCVRPNNGLRARRYSKTPDTRSTDEILTTHAQKLVDAGRLVHPDVVKKRVAQAVERISARNAEREQEENAEFDRRAREALRINDTGPSEAVDRVVAAMRWAQSQ